MKIASLFFWVAALSHQVVQAKLNDQPVRIKNFREILYSYEGLLRVDANSTDIRDMFRSVKDRLPTLGNVDELSSSTVLAMTELSGLFCSKAIQIEKDKPFGERNLYSDIDFSRGTEQYTSYLRHKLNQSFEKIFWNRSMSSIEAKVMDESLVKQIQLSNGTNSEHANILLSHCVSFATSLAFLVK